MAPDAHSLITPTAARYRAAFRRVQAQEAALPVIKATVAVAGPAATAAASTTPMAMDKSAVIELAVTEVIN